MGSSVTSNSELSSAPKPDELEVSLFGPGVGECAVVHFGAGEWAIVDSCLDAGKPVALEYLRAMGVDVGAAVKLIVVTHWHDDHARGAAEILVAAPRAKLVCSAALRCDEFQSFVAASSDLRVESQGSSGVDELRRCFEVIQARTPGGNRSKALGPEWTRADQQLIVRASSAVPPAQVVALSPSAGTLSRGFHELAKVLPKLGAPKRAAVAMRPNETCVTLSVQFGQAFALLGADLENTGSPLTGWGAVLSTTSRPSLPAHVFKVPHHGSENAYHPEVWSQMLAKDVVALVTPYAAGSKPLPAPADIKRMKGHTRSVLCTSPAAGRKRFEDPVVERTVSEVARVFRPRSSRMGHWRVRMSATGSTPVVERFGAAFAA
jgi:beta-lactamase superfamily II metal-dependent hydrolase